MRKELRKMTRVSSNENKRAPNGPIMLGECSLFANKRSFFEKIEAFHRLILIRQDDWNLFLYISITAISFILICNDWTLTVHLFDRINCVCTVKRLLTSWSYERCVHSIHLSKSCLCVCAVAIRLCYITFPFDFYNYNVRSVTAKFLL